MNQEIFTKEYIYKRLKEFNPVGSKVSQIKKNLIKYIKENNISIEEFNRYILGSPYFYQSHHKNSLITLIALSELKNSEHINFEIPDLNYETKKIFFNKLKSGTTHQDAEKILKSAKNLNIHFYDQDLFYFMISNNLHNLYHFKNIFLQDNIIKKFFINSFIKHIDYNTLPSFEEESYVDDSIINKFSRELLSKEQYQELYCLIKNFKEFINKNDKDLSLLYTIGKFPEYMNEALAQTQFTSFEEPYIQIYKKIEFNPITFDKDKAFSAYQISKNKLYNNELILNDEFQFSSNQSFFDIINIPNSSFGKAVEIFNHIILNIDINPFIPYKNNKKTLFDFVIDIFNVEPVKGYQENRKKEVYEKYIMWIDKNKKYLNSNLDIQTDKIKQPFFKTYIENIILNLDIQKQPLNIKKNRL